MRYVSGVELFWQYREEERIIFLPANYIKRMHAEAMEDLAVRYTGESNIPRFISEGDVLFAWWARVVLRAAKPSPNQTINMRNTYCCRSLLADLGHIPSAGSALVTNAVFTTLTFLLVHQVLEEPLGFTAFEVRNSLVDYRYMN